MFTNELVTYRPRLLPAALVLVSYPLHPPGKPDQLRTDHIGRGARDAVRRSLVEVLLHGNRADLARTLDETLLGLRPRPALFLAA